MQSDDRPTHRDRPRPLRCGMTRRRFVQGGVAGAAATTVLAAGLTQERDENSAKSSKEVAGYIEKDGPSAQTCTTCHWFYDPDECVLVVSPVSPWGYCNYYED